MRTTTGSLRRLAVLVGCCALMLSAAATSRSPLPEAESRYQRTDYQGSLALLNKQTDDSATNFLVGRDYFMLGDYKKATDYLQKAIASCPGNAEYADWLGRIYGKRAETSNPLLAPGLAVKARQAFEHSIEIDPKNKEALDDLFDYYLEAPGFLGGGYEKASEIARRLAVVDPPEGFAAQAKLANKRKEYAAVEAHLREAMAADRRSVGHSIALANFLAKQGRSRESDEILLAAQKEQPDAVRLWFARAKLLIEQKRGLNEAKLLLDKYVHAEITVDDPPKEKALELLKQLGSA